MPIRTAEAVWEGNLAHGKGTMVFTGCRGPYSFASRMEAGPGTNPEELLGAAHAGCFSMALALALSREHTEPRRITTTAQVHFGQLGQGYAITQIALSCEAEVHGVSEARFQQLAADAKRTCPLSQALASVPIRLSAILVQAPGERKTA